jgi:RND family efflux transporter MFP subunit
MTSLFHRAHGEPCGRCGTAIARRAFTRVPGVLVLLAVLLFAACSRDTTSTKKALDLASVSVTQPSLREVSDVFSILGSVQAANEVTALSETSGAIIEMPAKTGAAVTAGAPLVRVDKDLREAAFIAAEAAYKKASKDAERVASLHDDKLISDADIEAARLGEASSLSQYLVAKKELENTTIRAAIGGIIADTYVSVGEQVGMGSKIALIVDTSRLKVRVLLPEGTAVRHRAGDKVTVSSDLFPSRSFVGRIASVSVRGDETHSFPTEVTLLGDAASELRAGMSARLLFGGNADRKALLIPRAAIIGSIRDPEVFVVVNGVATRRGIKVGEEYGTDIEVLGGLTATDKLVTGGQTLLTDNQAVKIVETGAGT